MPYHRSNKVIYYMPRAAMSPKKSPKSLLLSHAIEGFLLSCRARKLSANTVTDYSRTANKLLAHVGDSAIADITTTQVEAFLAAQNGTNKTILNYHIGLSALWSWAMREEYVEKHIIRLIRRPEPEKVVIQPFTQLEIKAMLSSTIRNEERDQSLIFLMLDTGLRASELISISKEDIDMVHRRIKVMGKGRKERMVPFSNRTGSALFRYLTTLKPTDKLYPYSRNSLADLVRYIGERASVKGAHPHRFRHTFAINFLRNGGDPYTLQDILGHSTMEMVKRYLHIAQVDIDAAHMRASPVEHWKL